MKLFSGLIDRTKAKAVLNALEEERLALRKGKTDNLPGRVARLEALATQLENLGEPEDAQLLPLLESIRAAAARNARLIGAVKTGLRAAEDRLIQMTAPSQPLRTYNDSGTQVLVTSSAGATVKRF